MFVAAGAVALMACESVDPPGPREIPIVGHIDFSDMADELRMPKTATAGVRVEIVFWTVGGGCVRWIDETEVTFNGGSAVVTPYDILQESPVCAGDIRYLKHGATLIFDEPGTRRIVLRYSTSDTPKRDRTADGRKEFIVEVSPAR